MQQVSVSDLMRVCPTAVIGENVLVREAAELLVVHNLTVLIVRDCNGRVVGVVPEATVIRHLMQTIQRDEPVSYLMSRHVETVRANADLNSVLHLFRSSCHAVVPVVDESNVFVGLLNRNDVVRYLLSEGSSQRDSDATQPEPSVNRKPHFMKRSEAQSHMPGASERSSDKSRE